MPDAQSSLVSAQDAVTAQDRQPNPSDPSSHSDARQFVTPDEPTRASSSPNAGFATEGAPDLSDAHIEGYRLENELHRGGQGIVYRATQLSTKRVVALKVLLEGPFAGENARRRFEREIELAASLQHPNIVTILESGNSGGRYYFAMEFVDGQRLDRYLAQHRPPLEASLEVLAKICDAVNYAHQRGVIHRDLKPSNILVDAGGNPRVLDFGLAKGDRTTAGDGTTIQVLSTAGQILGTVAYMSPEQARGEADVDVRSDVYSLGVVFYEALVGQSPYPVSGALGDVLHNIVRVEPKPLSAIRNRVRFGGQVDDEVQTILLKALEKERERRYQTVGELGRDLRHLLAGEPIEAKRASTWYILRKLLKRHKLAVGTVAAGLAGLLVFSATSAYLYEREKAARYQADDLRAMWTEQAREAKRAEMGEREARKEAQDNAQAALATQHQLQRALAQQRIERGNLARERGGLVQARDSYWEAYLEQRGPAPHWALRQYYVTSGDDGAIVLSPSIQGAVAVAPEQQLAVAVEAQNALAVRNLKTGALLSWLRTPAQPEAVSISPRGRVAAAGPGWVRVWDAGQVQPLVALTLATEDAPVSAHITADGATVFVVSLRGLNAFDAQTGQLIDSTHLSADVSAPAAVAADRAQVAIPTEGGLLQGDLTDGKLQISRAWTAVNASVQGVRYLGDSHIAFLADTVYLATLQDGRPTRWTTPVNTSGRWDYFDVAGGGALVALGRSGGDVALFERGTLSGTWRTTLESLERIWLDYSRKAVLGLDSNGGVTAWVRRQQMENVRSIHSAPVQSWTVAADGSTVVWIDDENRAAIYSPARFDLPRPLGLSRLRGFAEIISPKSASLAVSGDGARAVIHTGNLLRLLAYERESDQFTQRAFSHDTEPLDQVALDRDGHVLAIHSHSVEGDRHWIAFHRWDDQSQIPESRNRAGLQNLPLLGTRFTFTGSRILEMAFLPHSSVLLVTRSNGELLRIDPQEGARLPDTPPGQPVQGAMPPRPWITLDSPARRIALDRSGSHLAAWCDDGVLRVVALNTGEITSRILAGAGGKSLAFNAAGDSLILRFTDGDVAVFERSSGERIAGFRAPIGEKEAALGAWIGDDDRLLLSSNGRVFEYRYQAVDRLIESNAAYARRRAIHRLIAAEEFEAAWTALTDLAEHDQVAAASERTHLLDLLLRRPGVPLLAVCQAELDSERDAARLLRLGNAAFDGEKFDLAGQLLQRAQSAQNGVLDVGSMRRLAECDYLMEHYAAAADALAQVARAPDLAPAERPIVELERIAALVLAGRQDDARVVADALTNPDESSAVAVASRAARSIADFLVGTNSETVLSASIEQLLRVFGMQWLSYQDDAFFFRGELARAQGQILVAAVQYQRCIDQASDVWPANWARYRLLQLSQRFPAQ